MKKSITFYEYTTVCHEYQVEVDIPDDVDLREWLEEQDETGGLSDLPYKYKVYGKEISNEVEGLEVWDNETRELLIEQ
jgi:hypothetical protein